MNYCSVQNNKEHLITLIKWLIEEVGSSGGDGDALWYSKYYDVKDIKKLIIKENLCGKWWGPAFETEDTFCIGSNQEWLIITNNEESFKDRPPWTQCAIVL